MSGYARGTGRAALGITGYLVSAVSLVQHYSHAGLALTCACALLAIWGVSRMDRAAVKA